MNYRKEWNRVLDLSSSISNGWVVIVEGMKTIVLYDRKMDGGIKVHYTTVWDQGPRGWKCVGVPQM